MIQRVEVCMSCCYHSVDSDDGQSFPLFSVKMSSFAPVMPHARAPPPQKMEPSVEETGRKAVSSQEERGRNQNLQSTSWDILFNSHSSAEAVVSAKKCLHLIEQQSLFTCAATKAGIMRAATAASASMLNGCCDAQKEREARVQTSEMKLKQEIEAATTALRKSVA